MRIRIRTRKYSHVYGIVFLINSIAAIIFGSFGLGYDSYTHETHFGDGFVAFWNIFGGLASFLALGGVILATALIIFIIKYLADHPKVPNWVPGVVAVGFTMSAMFVGHQWIHLPSGAGWIVLGFLAFVAGQSWLVMFLSRRTRSGYTP